MVDVCVFVGHGRRPNGSFDPGSLGRDNRYEHDEAHEVVAQIDEALGRSGVSYYSESWGSAGNKDPNYAGSTEKANELRPKLAVEVHFDWNKAPRGGFGIYYPSSAPGKDIADTIRTHYGASGLPVRPNYADKRGLYFLKYTRVPAVVWECETVMDYPANINIQMGEAIAKGICTYLGKSYVAPRSDIDYKVAVIADNEIDMVMAHMLGRKWNFKVLLRGHGYKVGYAVAIGSNADKIVAETGDGIRIAGKNRYETADRVLAKIMGTAPDRSEPWS